MPEHVYLTTVPDSMSEPTAFNSRNIPSQVVVSRTTLCTLLSPPSFVSLFSQKFQRNHSLSASARSTEHLCWLPAKSNTCASVTCLGRLPKITPTRPPPVLAARQNSSSETPVRDTNTMRVAKGKFLTYSRKLLSSNF